MIDINALSFGQPKKLLENFDDQGHTIYTGSINISGTHSFDNEDWILSENATIGMITGYAEGRGTTTISNISGNFTSLGLSIKKAIGQSKRIYAKAEVIADNVSAKGILTRSNTADKPQSVNNSSVMVGGGVVIKLR